MSVLLAAGAGGVAPLSARLVVAGPNLTIDRTATIAALQPGRVLRTGPVAVTPGGKGVNVVRTAIRLAAEATLVGFVAGRIGVAAAAMLADERITLAAVDVPGELRSTAVLHEPDGRTTVINEPGPTIEKSHWLRFERVVDEALQTPAVLVCSGSIPPGAPADGYARLVAAAQRRGFPTVVDTSGPQLSSVLPAGPDLVTPNLAEAEAVLNGGSGEDVSFPADAARRALDAAAELVGRGGRAAVVTAAAAGAGVAWDDQRRWVPAPQVSVANPIGAGDSFAAAAALALGSGHGVLDAVVAGVAAGAAGVERPLAGDVDPKRVAELQADIRRALSG